MKFRNLVPLLIAGYGLPLFAAGQPNPPNWTTINPAVIVFDDSIPPATIQMAADDAAGQALGNKRGYALLFKPGTYNGLLINMREFGSLMGLGVRRSQTIINDVRAVQSNNTDPCIGALNDHWKSAENFQTTPINVIPNGGTIKGMSWAASQGSFLRKVQVQDSELFLSELINKGGVFSYGASTGAFLADCGIVPLLSTPQQDCDVNGGSQQQSLLRNVSMGPGSVKGIWTGGKWSQVFVGCSKSNFVLPTCGNCGTLYTDDPSSMNYVDPGCTCNNSLCCSNGPNGCVCDPNVVAMCNPIANTSPCGNFIIPVNGSSPTKSSALTMVDKTPKIAEKPYIAYDSGKYYLIVPQEELNKVGATPISAPIDPSGIIPFDDVYVASPSDTTLTINTAIEQGNHIILTPGVYTLDSPIVVNKPDIVILGIGFPRLVNKTNLSLSFAGNLINIGDVSGVRIAGIVFSNYTQSTDPEFQVEIEADAPHFLRWGETVNGSSGGYLYDCFGIFKPNSVQASKIGPSMYAMLQILSSNIVCDNVWLYRDSPSIQFFSNFPTELRYSFNAAGAQIFGNAVIAYGMSCDNAYENLLEWYGDNGKCYSFMGLFPMDIDPADVIHGNVYGGGGYLVNTVSTKVSGYTVSPVTNHEGYGVSVYSNFLQSASLTPLNGINCPTQTGENIIKFVNASTRYLGGLGGIGSVINGSGFSPGTMTTPGGSGVCILSPGPAYVCNSDGTAVAPRRVTPNGASCP